MNMSPENIKSSPTATPHENNAGHKMGTSNVLRKFTGGSAANKAVNNESFTRKITGPGSKSLTQELLDKLEPYDMSDSEIKVVAVFLRSYPVDKNLGGFVFEREGKFFINKEAFKSVSITDIVTNTMNNKVAKGFSEFADALYKCKALENSKVKSIKEFKELIGSETLSARMSPIENPPTNLEDLVKGNAVEGKEALYVKDYFDEIVLEDGTVTNRVEILTAKYLKELDLMRDPSGGLVYKSGTRKGKKFRIESNFGPLGTVAKKIRDMRVAGDVYIDSSVATMVPRFLSNLVARDMIRADDFQTASTPTNYTYLSKPIQNNYQTMLPTQEGETTALYYTGRKTYAGTSTPIDHDSATIRILDYKTAGIFQKSGLDDTPHLLYTFPLKPAEWVKKEQSVLQEKVNKGERSNAVVLVGGKEMQLTGYSGQETNTDAVFKMRYELLKLGVYSTGLAWEEQVRLYKALANGGGRAERIKTFAKEFGGNGITSFLTFEKNSAVSVLIYKLSQENPSLAHNVFQKTSQIIDQIKHIDLFLENTFGQENPKKIIREKIRDILLGKATSVLESAAKNEGSEEQIIEKLEAVNEQTTLFASSFKALVEEGVEISLEDIGNAELVMHTGSTLSREDYGLMFDMYAKNQGANSSKNQELILKSFSETAENPNARFHMFKWNNKLQGFVAFQDDKNGFAKGSAFNVDPETRGYKIGEAILTQVIRKEAEAKPLIADVVATNHIVPKYLDTGWVATKFFVDNNDPILDIVQDSASNELYWGKKATPEAIMSLTSSGRSGRDSVTIEVAKNQKELIENYKDRFERGLCLTRIVKNDAGDLCYGVFEPFLKPEPKRVAKKLDEDSIDELLTV